MQDKTVYLNEVARECLAELDALDIHYGNIQAFTVNAFSLQMLPSDGSVSVETVTEADIPSDVVSCIGHADTANVLTDILGMEIPVNRMSVTLNEGDVLYVAQITGGRLPEGSTTLPNGFAFKFIKVKFQGQ